MANLRIPVPAFNFDLIQGQDLTLTFQYVRDGIQDSMAGATLLTTIREYTDGAGSTPKSNLPLVEEISMVAGRLEIVGLNTFILGFPAQITRGYSISSAKGPVAPLIYEVEYTRDSFTRRLFEGTISFKLRSSKS